MLWKDLIERTVWTYVEAFVGFVVASQATSLVNLDVWQSAAIAAIPAGLAVVKSAAASRVGDFRDGSTVNIDRR